MKSTVFLTGALALLCLIAVVISICKRKSSKDEKHKSSGISGVFFAVGFLPMVMMTLSSLRSQSPILTQFFAYLRNPFLTVEFTLDAFAGLGQFSFVMDFFTALLFGSTVAITLSTGLTLRPSSDHLMGRAGRGSVHFFAKSAERKEVTLSYLKYCRILS